MGSHPGGGGAPVPPTFDDNQSRAAAPPRRAGEVIPLAALAVTTMLLAASAFRVVASSIGEPRTVEPAEAIARPAAFPEPACGKGGLAADFAFEPEPEPEPEPDQPPAPPSPARGDAMSPPPAPHTSALRVAQPTRPSMPPSPVPDRPPVPPPTAEAKKATSQSGSAAQKPPAPAPPIPPAPKSEARRVLVRDENGQPVVARILGRHGDRTAVLLPDGQVGWPDGLIYTDKPFVPATKGQVRDHLLASEFAGFHAIETKHYVVLYQGSKSFAQASAGLLENLYSSLSGALNRRDVPVHEPEFPLVAVIFKNEDDLRRRKPVARDVQAYYELMSNRIFLYEKSRRDQAEPEVAALLKPQTVAHEGAHQVLQNIGVQARMSEWPIWLVEGLAEYCASPKIGKNGAPTWVGLGQVNLIHMATIRDVNDPLSTQVRGAKAHPIARDPKQPMVEYLVTRTALTPTDYALSWALTHHLAMKRLDDFLDYVREMSKLAPFEIRTPEQHLRAFRAAFGTNLGKLDEAVGKHLGKLKGGDALPYYAVKFEQPIGNGMIRRSGMVSQSPLYIRQWIEGSTRADGSEPRWEILERPTKAQAILELEHWIGSS